MPYVKQSWADGAEGGTPLTADRLSHLEDGIAAAIAGDQLDGAVAGNLSTPTSQTAVAAAANVIASVEGASAVAPTGNWNFAFQPTVAGGPLITTPADGSVTDAKVAAGAAISADKLADGVDSKVMTAAERTTIAGLAPVATSGAYADLTGKPVLVTSVVGKTGAVTGAQIAADPAVSTAFGPLPTHAGSRAGRYDPALSIYNLKASNTRRLRMGLGLARVAGATGVCRIGFIGDSLCAGMGSLRGTNDPVTQLRNMLGAAGFTTGDVVPAYTNGVTEPRWTLTGNTGATKTFPWQLIAQGSTATLTGTGTVLELVTSNQLGVFTYAIDGGAAVTVNSGGVAGPKTTRVTGLSNGSHTVVLTGGSGGFYLYAGGFLPATGAILQSGGILGATTADWLDAGNYAPLKALLRTNGATGQPTFDAVVIELGVNDSTAIPVATFATNIATLVDAVTATGATAILSTSNPPDTAIVSTAQFDTFISAIYDVADSRDVPLLDLADRFGLYAQYNANGVAYDGASDQWHLSPAGYAAKANAWRETLTR